MNFVNKLTILFKENMSFHFEIKKKVNEMFENVNIKQAGG